MKCELCGRENELNFHHLIPTSQHTNKWFRKNYTYEQLQEGIYICEKFIKILLKKTNKSSVCL